MAARNPTRHGATARAGRTSAATKKKTAAGRAPAKRSRASSTAPVRKSPGRTPARKAPARASSPRRRRSFGWKYLPIALVAFLLVLGWTLYPVVRLHYRQQRENAKLERQLADIKKRNTELRKEIETIQKPEGIEAAARERLGFVKPGEQMYVVIPEGGAPASAGATAAPSVRTASLSGDAGVWVHLLDSIFGVGE